MSRSYKKNPIIKDGSKWARKYSHHVTRTQVRKVLTSGIEHDEMIFPTSKSKELVNQWDICDYKHRLEDSTFWLPSLQEWYTIKPSQIREYKNK